MIDRIAFVIFCSLNLFFLLRAAYFAGMQKAEKRQRESLETFRVEPYQDRHIPYRNFPN